MVVDPAGETTPDRLGHEHLRTLQNLLTFATDKPNGVEEIIYRGEAVEPDIAPILYLIFDPLFVRKRRKNPSTRSKCFSPTTIVKPLG